MLVRFPGFPMLQPSLRRFGAWVGQFLLMLLIPTFLLHPVLFFGKVLLSPRPTTIGRLRAWLLTQPSRRWVPPDRSPYSLFGMTALFDPGCIWNNAPHFVFPISPDSLRLPILSIDFLTSLVTIFWRWITGI